MSLTKIKSSNITTTGVTAGSYTAADITVNSSGQVTSASSGTGGGGATVTILSVIVTSDTYANLDDTAVDISGGYIKIIGTGFASGCTVLVNNIPATSTTFIGPTEVRAQLPATAAGTYVLYVVNANGSVAIRVNGITFSATPSWINSSDLSSYPVNEAISIQLSATSATTYALQSGSSLPAGLTLSSSGLLSGTVTGLENDTSYSFAIIATDAELQDSPRTFTITIVVQVQVSRSLRFNAPDTTYLSRTFPTAGNRRLWTFSAWYKRSNLTDTANGLFQYGPDGNNQFRLHLDTSGTIVIMDRISAVYIVSMTTTAVFRDPGAWYHIVITYDTAQATAADRVKLYINGTQITSFSTPTYPSQNAEGNVCSASSAYIGRGDTTSVYYYSGYLTEVQLVDGQALTPTAFALTNTTTGQYGPRKYMGSYGTNGFYLPFTDNSSVLNLGRNYEPLTADPLWPQTVLLLNGTGTNNAQNNTFTDSSTNAFAITRNGNTTQGTFSPFSQTGWGNYFDGTGDSLTIPSGSSISGAGNFTVEFWIYPTTFASGYQVPYINETSGGFAVLLNSTGTLSYGRALVAVDGTTTGTVTFNQWNHVAFVRSGTGSNQFICYINGSSAGSFTNSTNYSSGIVRLGTDAGGTSFPFLGYLSNVRNVTVAVYTGAFTPPTSPLAATQSAGTNISAITGTQTSLLTCQSNRFIDASSNGFTITRNGDTRVVAFSPFNPTSSWSAATNGGSGYFDGSGDWINPNTTSANLALGSGDFTIEFWLYTPRGATRHYICDFRNNGSTGTISPMTAPALIWGDNGADTDGNWFRYLAVSNGSVVANADLLGVTLSTLSNQWNHIAVVRSSGTVYGYLNGVRKNSVADSTNYNVNCSVSVASFANGTVSLYLGYISNFRVVKGTAVYTGTTYTVPTAPLTAITNTQLLLNFTNAGIQDATGDNNIETVGDAKISTAQSKFGGGSMAFDGTGDYLTIADSPVLELGTGDFTIEAWIYPTLIAGSNRGIFGHGTDGSNWWAFYLQSTGTLEFAAVSGNSIVVDRISSNSISLNTWTHVAATRNGSTFKLWINGSEPPSYTGSPATTSSAMADWSSPFWIGGPRSATTTSDFVGYIQDLRVTRGYARYTGTFTPPTAQFAYNQSDIGYKQWVPANFSVTAGVGNDSLLDTPTNWGVDTGLGGEVRGNYCTLNPNIPPKNSGTASRTLANGNLDLAGASGGWTVAGGTFRIFAGSGRWYFETTGGVANSTVVGFHKLTRGYFLDAILGYTDGADTEGYGYGMDGNKINNGGSAYGASWTTSDVIGCAIDASAATSSITFYKNGVSQGVAFSNLTGDFIPAVSIGGAGPVVCNFGQRPFAYSAPSGFKCMNTHNLPALAVVKSNTATDTVLYTGNGSTQTVSGLNFSPDLVWIKDRSSSVVGHRLYDTVRGATKEIYTHATNAETIDAAGLTAFTTNGFTTGNSAGTNTNGDNLVAWAWDAGTTTVTSTAGTISAQVRANPTTGFSIVTYTGTGANATVGHGLSTAPSMIIVKIRSSSAENWLVYHASLSTPSTAFLYLNSTNAASTLTTYWNGGPTSSVFGLGAYSGINNSTSTYVAYCWATVPGYSAFGSYVGNGSADGPFIYTGFRPRFILLKSSTVATTNWQINDTARDTYNVANKRLAASAVDAEATNFDFGDILSNGFKIRQTDQTWNSNGQTYIYAAFAEQPFKYSRAR